MRVKASSVFCHGQCQEYLPRSKFNLLHWNKSQICSACETIESKEDIAKAKTIRNGEYKQNSRKPKAETNSANPEKVKTRRSIEQIKEKMELDKEFEL